MIEQSPDIELLLEDFKGIYIYTILSGNCGNQEPYSKIWVLRIFKVEITPLVFTYLALYAMLIYYW